MCAQPSPYPPYCRADPFEKNCNMDFLIGITGADFVLMAADCSQARSIIVMKKDMDKSIKLAPNALMLTSGPVGDCTNFGEYIQKNLKLNQLRNGPASLSPLHTLSLPPLQPNYPLTRMIRLTCG